MKLSNTQAGLARTRGLRLLVVGMASLVGAFGLSERAVAAPVTYTWQGNNGATGSFTLDGAHFDPSNSFQFIAESNLTAFNFTIAGVTFVLSDVDGASNIVFNSTKASPVYLDGAGIAATDAAGDNLIFFGNAVDIEEADNSVFSSNGTFAPANVPEPTSLALFGFGLAGLAATRRARTKRTRTR